MEIRYRVPRELEPLLQGVHEADIAKLFTDVLSVACNIKRKGTLNANIDTIKRTGHSLEKSIDSNYQLLQTIISNQTKILSYLEDGVIDIPIQEESMVQPIDTGESIIFDDDDITY